MNSYDTEAVAPLAVALCEKCGLSQLTVVVDPDVLYGGYKFRSGASTEWVAHCSRFANDATVRFQHPGWVLDIAANDGTQLAEFAKRGWNTMGVEPADISPVSHVGRIERAFWSLDVAKTLRREHGVVDLIVAQNVFGHVDDPVGFLGAVDHILAPGGLCAIEVPVVRDMIANCAFDTIYHEHLSYWSTSSIVRCAHRAGFILAGVDRFPNLHGGSRRFWLQRARDKRPTEGLPVDSRPYRKFAADVDRRLLHVMQALEKIGAKTLWAYGASAKGTVMLNALKARGNTVWPTVMLDDVPEKVGLLSPGLHIPIQAPSKEWPDVLWILSWNWAEQLRQRARKAGFAGEFFLTHPTVRLEQ